MDIVVKTSGLAKKFGETSAVSALDLEIRKGEIFGIVGPDGAGKTTALRMLSTALLPDSGTASVMGFDCVNQAEKVKLRIGYMPQRFSLYGDLTVNENIDFFADLYQVPADTVWLRKKELLKANNLEDFTARLADQLSGGMKKKLALTCTLIHTPDVIILDEPTTGVDPLSRREFWRILYSLVPDVTIIISTPYMDEAERCNRIGLMHKGKILVADSPKQVLSRFSGGIIEIKCDCLRKSRQMLLGYPGVTDIHIFGDSLRLYLDDAGSAIDNIRAFISEKGYTVHSIKVSAPKLEDYFISVLK